MDNLEDGGSCTCPFQTAKRRGEADDDGRCDPAGGAAACIACCKDRFVQRMWPGYGSDTLSGDMCASLSALNANERLVAALLV